MDEQQFIEMRFHQLVAELSRDGGNAAAIESHLRPAFEYAVAAHGSQRRRDGTLFITHPLEVAFIAADLVGFEADTLSAAFLHDVIEDTGVTKEEISARFGGAVAGLVDGVTKLTRTQFISKEEEQSENLRKMFLAMADDTRVVLLKMADRAHNMRTIEFHNEDNQRQIALETMEVYAPLAHKLGVQKILEELEDRALQCLDPVAYQEINDELALYSIGHKGFMEVPGAIRERLSQAGIESVIQSRIKHNYSIHRKVYGQNRSMNELYDIYAVRVIVQKPEDCYPVLGHIHELFLPVSNRFKVYIGSPKPNGYQSLHTTVLGRDGVPFEVQIRTEAMHRVAEYGVAAHWKYKTGGQEEAGRELEWARSLLASNSDTDSAQFLSSVKHDLYDDRVLVYTPKGDIKNFPAGATPVDFAYAIHSQVGNRMFGAKVNGRIVPLTYHLQTGDRVEIMTGGNTRGPSRDWLKIAKTGEARGKILQWFKRERRDENIENGRAEFERELTRQGLARGAVMQVGVIGPLLEKMHYATIDDLFAAIGHGGTTANRAVLRVKDELRRHMKLEDDEEPVKVVKTEKSPKRVKSGVVVEGAGDCLVKFAKCCGPVPGDPIVAFTTRGAGFAVHRADCANARRDQASQPDRFAAVQWRAGESLNMTTPIQVLGKNRAQLLHDISEALKTVPIRKFDARELGRGAVLFSALIEIENLNQLTGLLNRLRGVPGVTEIFRGNEKGKK